MTPLQALAPSTLAISVANQQFRNVKNRLMLLRRGAGGGFDVSGLNGSALPSGLAFGGPGQASGGAGGDKDSSFDKLGVFVNGNFGVGDKDRTDRELGFEYDSQGVTAGVDYRFTDDFVFGGTFGYNAVKSDFDATRGNLNLDGYSYSLYSTYYKEDFYVDGIFSGGWNDYDMRRNINFSGFGGPINQTAKGATQGNDFSFNISSGYDFHNQGLTYGPYGRVSYQNVQIDGFQENASNPGAPGFGSLATVGKQNADSLQTALGGQLSYALSMPFGVLMPTARAEWIHEFHDGSRPVNWQFSNDPAQSVFTVVSDNPDRNYANLGAGMSATFTHGVSAFLFYEAMVGRQSLAEHTINLGVRGEF
ncbi:autotransporter outer membrane beta-barrel domain-containing protein [Methylomicrobium lacus]|uniref:autotransporter outer membrane beta-barrel domain-containing protein n=1 Tax=Methylomicrobium lacus TaxID=136992 RepID=UPI0035A8F8F9